MLTINKSTLVFNSAGNYGGVVDNNGYQGNAKLTINTSTLANNTATIRGGAIVSEGTSGIANVTLQGATLVYNNATNAGGIYSISTTLRFYNSIIANNTATNGDGNVNGTIATSNYSLYSTNVNLTGAVTANNILNTNPRLGLLGNYGGPTQTIRLLPGSPAITGGFNVIGTTDQRGVTYVSNGMGAFAYVPETPSTTVSTASDILDESDNLISLREAIIYASTIGGSNQTITFNSTLTASGNVTIVLNSNTANGYGPLLVNLPATNLTIQGPASGNSITVSGNGATGIFSINSNTTITNLTLTQGDGSGLVAGGAIYSNNLLRLDNITINNSTAADGAGLYQNGGFANLNSSNIGNSVYLSGGANLTASGGQWTGSLTGNNANVINISNLQSNLNIGATVARILTAG
ncbi:MAG: choice-of-anchor Q domain-containing protein, partial [bacterium]